MDLVIGTANLGQRYGLMSKQLTKDQFLSITQKEKGEKGFAIDTSPDYGVAESICEELKDDSIQIFSKMKYLKAKRSFAPSVLRQGHYKKILVHNWEELSQSEREIALTMLDTEREKGTISGFGFSTYENFCDFDLLDRYQQVYIQAPVNVLNQFNLIKISQIKANFPKVRILARSIFLQGLLVDELRVEGRDEHPHLVRFKSFCKQLGKTPFEIALEFLIRQKDIDGLVVGVDSVEHWEKIRSIMSSPRQKNLENVDWWTFNSSEKNLIDPRKWL